MSMIVEKDRKGMVLCLLMAVLMMFPAALCAEIIRVTGKVVSKEKKTPVFGVNISLAGENRLLATTDADGRFAFDVRSDARLRFSSVSYEPVTVKVNGRQYIEVEIKEVENLLGEAVAVAKRIENKITVDKTAIVQRGDTFDINTVVRFPLEMFHRNCRVVVQPVIYRVDRGDSVFIRPMVYDAWEYSKTQDRMYDFELRGEHGDPLAEYIVVKNDSLRDSQTRNKDALPYSGSAILPNSGPQLSCKFYIAMEDYHKVRFRDTTTVAKGRIFPLQYMDYSFGPARELTDESYYPTPEQQPRETNGAINLRFRVGKSTLDLSDPGNAAEVASLNRLLKSVAEDKNCSIQEFNISGTASPEGSYKSNAKLAEGRMKTALDLIVGQLDDKTRRGMKVSSTAKVEGWQKVADLMRNDSLQNEADEMERIVRRYKNIDEQSRHIARLPYYNSVIKEKYLPRLRHVDYKMVYTVYRPLTVEEIRAQYEKDYRLLSRYEFFSLYRGEPDTLKREKICRQALEMYPSFMVAANDLAAALINSGRSDHRILLPFAGRKAPEEVNRNQVVALLDSACYGGADTLRAYLTDEGEGRLIKAVVSAYNGRLAENAEILSATSPLNRVLVLLAMKKNEEALEKAMELPDGTAMTHYVRAICLNRMSKPVEAETELKKSFKLKPELEKKAEVDGDINTLILKDFE